MVKLVSLGNKFIENIEFDVIDWDDEYIIKLEYITKYHMDLRSSQTCLFNVKHNTKEDMFRGVVFGLELEET